LRMSEPATSVDGVAADVLYLKFANRSFTTCR
jgi:hypothetical protein